MGYRNIVVRSKPVEAGLELDCLHMDKIDELLEFVNECIETSDWDQLATAFILPGELEPAEIVIRSVGVRSAQVEAMRNATLTRQ